MLDINKLCPGCMNENDGYEQCPICGYEGEQNNKNHLPVKYILSGRYVIGKVLFTSCESVVYLAYDTSDEKSVNIKEFFPEDIALRGKESEVVCAPEKADIFKVSLDEFWQLNKSLLNLDLPALSKTLSVFEENGTVYAVSEAVVGITLKSFLKKNGNNLKWEQARPLFLPLIDTVIGLNKAGIIHGGISPESIMVCRDGRMRLMEILIDRVRRSNNQMTAQIYAGYAAVEQYNTEEYEIGEYTDVYALSATLFRVLIGTVPAESVKRLEDDNLSVPSSLAGALPRQVLVAMANGLQVLPKNRTETAEIFRDELVYGETRENIAAAAVAEKSGKKAEKGKTKKEKGTKGEKGADESKKEKKNTVKVWLITLVVTVLAFLCVAAVLVLGPFKNSIFKTTSSKTSSVEDDMPSMPSIGDYDSSTVMSQQTFDVPNLLGKNYADVAASDQYPRFKIVLEKKVYSNIFQKGTICEQSVKDGSAVPDGTEIKVTVSLGARDFQMPNVTGMSELAAKVQLLRMGILYENIELVEKYDSDRKPSTIIDQYPAAGNTVNEDSKVRIYINSYAGEDEDN